ncbi:flagellar hook-length control protein FliK (plasmid) [Citricoccus nitrophenolicus]
MQQLTAPVSRIAGQTVALPDGSHRSVVRISPESLGPVTIEATSRDGVVKLEITAGTEAGRENLRMVIGELRRELATSQPGASLDLASGNRDQPRERDTTGASGRQDGHTGAEKDHGGQQQQRPQTTAELDPTHPNPGPQAGVAGLDVYA